MGEQQATGAVAIVVDDVQWADRRSVEALTFTLRGPSSDPVIAVMIYRGTYRLDESAQRMLLSIENRLRLPLDGLRSNDVASLAAALTSGPLDDEAVQRLYRDTDGHPLYLRTDGWPTARRPGAGRQSYQRAEDTASRYSPVCTARLLLAHGELLRRTGNKKGAVERLRRAHDLYRALRAEPFIARTEEGHTRTKGS